MAINSISGKSNTPLTIKIAPKAETDSVKETTTGVSEKNDSVAITAIAKEIHKAFETSSASSAIDFERVAAVKKALADGSYTVNAEKVAEKMIQFEKLNTRDNST